MDANERALFLRKRHLFRELNDEQLLDIAEKLSEESFDTDEEVIKQGAVGDSFYLLVSGKVRVVQQGDGRQKELVTLVRGDYFGEMELFTGSGRLASVVAADPVLLLRFSKTDFEEILITYPSVKLALDVSIASRKLARKMRFKWLGSDEVVYFLARKTVFFLLQMLIVPVLALLVPAFFLLWGGLTISTTAITIGVITLLLALGWIVWRILDWGNDYYIVTNKRVVWLEKVIALYDSRTESPLAEILSVGVESDIVGRVLGHGDVVVRTFVGSIPFKHVHHPQQAAFMVEEYWHRVQKVSEQAEKEAFKDALRERLGLLGPTKEVAATPPPAEDKQEETGRPNFLKLFIINIFKQRIEEGNTITYRKHWFVLLQQIFMPSVIGMALLGLTLSRYYVLASSPDLTLVRTLADGSRSLDTAGVVLPLLLLITLGWWIYQYVDWTNDIFRVTSDQIFDIDKKPLGTEERRAAPLDNILGTRYERIGFLGYILNFGTVHIDVGSAQFAFEDVLDPAVVQSDLDRRRLKRISTKKAAEQASERSRVADWMITYHQNIDEFQQDQDLTDTNPKTE